MVGSLQQQTHTNPSKARRLPPTGVEQSNEQCHGINNASLNQCVFIYAQHDCAVTAHTNPSGERRQGFPSGRLCCTALHGGKGRINWKIAPGYGKNAQNERILNICIRGVEGGEHIPKLGAARWSLRVLLETFLFLICNPLSNPTSQSSIALHCSALQWKKVCLHFLRLSRPNVFSMCVRGLGTSIQHTEK